MPESKRTVDIFGAVLLIIVFLPIAVLVTCAVCLSSSGPVIFSQERVGYRGKSFTIYKFRTLRKDSGKRGTDFVFAGDPRVTKVGRFLRSTRLDELPQLWNVLCGEMSLVGPRPVSLLNLPALSTNIPRYCERFAVKPGLTGLASIRANEKSLEGIRRAIRLDLFYIRRRCFLFDLWILTHTVSIVLSRKGV